MHDCSQNSSESDCNNRGLTCHDKTIAPDDDDDTLAAGAMPERDDDTLAGRDTLLAGRDAEIERPSKDRT